MCTRLCNLAKIGNIDGSLEACLVGSVKDGIQRNVLENLVDSEFVRIEHHLGESVIEAFSLKVQRG